MVSTLLLIGVVAGFAISKIPALNTNQAPAAVLGAPSVADSGTPPAPVLTDEQYAELSDNLVEADDPVIGSADAPVTIVEFSDFQCPFCASFYNDTFSQIKSQYIDTGKVRLVYRDYPLGFHQQAQEAAEAAQCAHVQGKFWEMHDKIFANGTEWQGDDTTAKNAFKRYAGEIGLSAATFASCIDNGEQTAEVRNDLLVGNSNKVNGTPGFFINGRIVSGAQPFNVFQGIIDQLLAE